MFFCYAFVLGVALPFIFAPNLPAHLAVSHWLSFLRGFTALGSLSLIQFLWMSALFLFACAWFLRRKGGYALLLIASLLLAASRYYDAVDLSSPSHVSRFTGQIFDRVIVRGVVIRDPDERETSTYLDIQPQEIEGKSGKTALQGKTGLIRAQVNPSVGPVYERLAYGSRVEIHTALVSPRKKTNPGGFDFERYLYARGVYAVTSPATPIRDPGDILIIGEDGGINPLIDLSLKLKRRLLQTLRMTMPYPESGFLGGVSLGMRGGVPQKIRAQFQATGIAHVLAVSGLHVGFVHVLLLMICMAFRLPRKLSWFVIVAGLIVFAIITGASPATQRAVLMSSIGQFLYNFSGLNIRRSGQLTIPLAAFIILFFDPMKLPDGSFVLSFIAVWSLVHLVRPAEAFLKSCAFTKGFLFFPMYTILLGMTAISALGILPQAFAGIVTSLAPTLALPLRDAPRLIDFLPSWGVMTGLLYLTGIAIYYFYKTQKRDILEELYGLSIFGKGMLIFTCAQFAINIGMTWPLSSIFFQRFSISGFYANFLAIPLIGFIVQLGLIAGLADLLFSSIGLAALGHQIALYIGGFNWLLCRAFLSMAENWGNYIYYPHVSALNVIQTAGYYSAILAIALYEPIGRILKALIRLWESRRTVFVRCVAAGAFALALLFFFAQRPAPAPALRIYVLEAGFGSSILIQSPSGKAFLVDAGWGGRGGGFEDTVAHVLSRLRVSQLEAVILTNPLPSRVGGVPYILENFGVKRILSALPSSLFEKEMIYPKFLRLLGEPRFLKNPYAAEPTEIFVGWYDLLKSLPRDPEFVSAGQTLYEETVAGARFAIEALHPGKRLLRGTDDDVGNNSLVLRVSYGEKSVLLPGAITAYGELALLSRYGKALHSDVLVMPRHGSLDAATPEFLRKVSPGTAIYQYNFLNRFLRARTPFYFYEDELEKSFKRHMEKLPRVFRTDQSGAVLVETDGRTLTVKSHLGHTGLEWKKAVEAASTEKRILSGATRSVDLSAPRKRRRKRKLESEEKSISLDEAPAPREQEEEKSIHID